MALDEDFYGLGLGEATLEVAHAPAGGTKRSAHVLCKSMSDPLSCRMGTIIEWVRTEAMAADPLTKLMDSLIMLCFVVAKSFKIPAPRRKTPTAVAIAAASLMARAAGASAATSVTIRETPGPGTCLALAPAAGPFWPAMTALSIMLNVVLLYCCCRSSPPPPPERPVMVAVATPPPCRQRSVSTQSQCTYKRGPGSRFHGAYNFEGIVETHLH